MKILNILSLLRNQKGRAARPAPAGRRLQMESLEERRVLAAIVDLAWNQDLHVGKVQVENNDVTPYPGDNHPARQLVLTPQSGFHVVSENRLIDSNVAWNYTTSASFEVAREADFDPDSDPNSEFVRWTNSDQRSRENFWETYDTGWLDHGPYFVDQPEPLERYFVTMTGTTNGDVEELEYPFYVAHDPDYSGQYGEILALSLLQTRLAGKDLEAFRDAMIEFDRGSSDMQATINQVYASLHEDMMYFIDSYDTYAGEYGGPFELALTFVDTRLGTPFSTMYDWLEAASRVVNNTNDNVGMMVSLNNFWTAMAPAADDVLTLSTTNSNEPYANVSDVINALNSVAAAIETYAYDGGTAASLVTQIESAQDTFIDYISALEEAKSTFEATATTTGNNHNIIPEYNGTEVDRLLEQADEWFDPQIEVARLQIVALETLRVQVQMRTLGTPPGGPDRYDYAGSNSTPGTAVDLGTLGFKVESGLSVHTAGDVDWYEFEAEASGVANVESVFLHAAGDLALWSSDANGYTLDYANSQTDNETISFNVLAGETYFVGVNSSGAGESNPLYNLIIDAPTIYADRFEENDSSSDAAQLGWISDVTLSGLSLDPRDGNLQDEDWYQLNPIASGTLTVSAEFEHWMGDVDLYLYDAAGVIDSSTTYSNDEQVSASVDAYEPYYLRVVGKGRGEHPDYDLNIDGPNDRYETNDGWDAATNLGLVGDRLLQMQSIHADSSAGDADYYRFTASGTGTVSIDLSFSNLGNDLELQAYDSSRQPIGTNASSMFGRVAEVDVVSGQEYFFTVRASQIGGSNPRYDLSINGPGDGTPLDAWEDNDAFAAAAYLGVAGEVTIDNLTLHSHSDLDYYRFIAGGDGEVRIELQRDLASIAFTASAFHGDDTANAVAQQLMEDAVGALTFDVEAGAEYFVEVDPGIIGSPYYRMTVSAPDIPADRFETSGNDDSSGAHDLGVVSGQIVEDALTIHAADGSADHDWFQMTTEGDGQLVVDLEFHHEQDQDIDLRMYRRGSDGTLEFVAESRTTSDNESVASSVVAGETYYVEVLPKDSDDVHPDYALSIDAPLPPFSARFMDARIDNRVDQDGDGRARAFDLTFDVESNIPGQVYAAVYQLHELGACGADAGDPTIDPGGGVGGGGVGGGGIGGGGIGGGGTGDPVGGGGTITELFLGDTAPLDVGGNGPQTQSFSVNADDLCLAEAATDYKLVLHDAAANEPIWTWTQAYDPDLGGIVAESSADDQPTGDPGETPTGDFDNDGDADGTDLLWWQRDDSAAHDAGELQAWKENYGAHTPPPTSTDATSGAATSGDPIVTDTATELIDIAIAAELAEESAAESSLAWEPAADPATLATDTAIFRTTAASVGSVLDLEDASMPTPSEEDRAEATARWLSEELLEGVYG